MLDEPGGVEAQFLGQFNLIEHLAIDLGVRLPGAVGYLQVEGVDTEFYHLLSNRKFIFGLTSATKSVLVRISGGGSGKGHP
jgi:hypothetical protein